ncbi:hypothetical protein BFC18_00745 [Alteromonas confluentis]|uniref:Uncharacterized protein n=2 Tax=Alteromonas confluentis TaxID=1656094 RepID=A0A1E7Z606_9ALTE|nr:hypothetical protein BFC18_00745 [Alteromonas confluentis]
MINTVKQLMDAFHQQKTTLPYVTLKSDGSYAGWVSDFRFRFHGQKDNLRLDLNHENDRFLLYVLAVVWSRSGPWENSAFFVAHLKFNKLDNPLLWLKKEFVRQQRESRLTDAAAILQNIESPSSRKKISFRADIFNSIAILATRWTEIEKSLADCAASGDYIPFVYLLRNIDGLGTNGKKMMIKIPLILREFRCQQIYSNIPGEYCCVPDNRVKVAAKALSDMKLSSAYPGLPNLLKASAQIYAVYGDLYDLPLFASNDLHTS